jgi:predicted ester cyclase
MSTPEENKALVRHMFDELNRGNLDIIEQTSTADFVSHVPPYERPNDSSHDKQGAAIMRAAFPDGRYTIDQLLGEGETVVIRYRFEGTHTGDFFGMPPTGRRMTLRVVDFVRVEGGKVAENWSITDPMGTMQQLGVIPAQR